MNAAHGRFVVVDHADAFVPKPRLQKDFLVDFAVHGLMVLPVAGQPVGRGHMSTDADRPLAVEPPFASGLAAPVVKDLTVVAKQAILDELLVAGVFLDFAPRAKAGEGRIEQCLEVPVNVAQEALKVSDLMEQERRNAQHMFGLRFGGQGHGINSSEVAGNAES
jgi:hypothetical protein